MTSEVLEPNPWSPGRWWTLIGVVFAGQLCLIFWLGRPEHPAPAPPADVPLLELSQLGARFDSWQWDAGSEPAGSISDLSPAQVMALTDPTLLALPHVNGFSGPAWLLFGPQQFHSFVWSEPPRWLELGDGYLGSEFRDFMQTNQFEPPPAWQQQELVLKLPRFHQAELPPARSRFWQAGGLLGRRILGALDLPSWPSADIRTNSVVQLLVAADGTPISATLLKTRGAPNAADDYALGQARKLRFEPLNVADPADPMAGLVWGQLVFEWHTLPLPPTNNAAEAGAPK